MVNKYERNIGTITQAEQQTLAQKRVCIVGGGGLGGYVSEMLVRLGVGTITMIDGDTFGENHLNRQLYATIASLGQSKSVEAARRARIVNPSVEFHSVKTFLTEHNAAELLQGFDLAFDALDNLKARLILESACEGLGLTLVHGAASQWQGTISVVYPGTRTLSRLYGGDGAFAAPLSVPSFTAAFTASLAVAQAARLLLNRGEIQPNRVIRADLLTGEFITETI